MSLFPKLVSVHAQSVLYESKAEDHERVFEALASAANYAKAQGLLSELHFAYGDSSAEPVYSPAQLEDLRARYPELASIKYEFFGKNMGSAGGQNRLMQDQNADFVLILNPDVILAPSAIAELLRPFALQSTGMTEARQLPIEHPKDYDPETGETSWATGACSMIPTSLARKLNGYDADSFFLYCDDVDLSWRVRLAGFKIIFVPSAAAFHGKRLSIDAAWMPSAAEQYYSAEAALLMAYKWSRPDLLNQSLTEYEASNVPHLQRAAQEFRDRQREGRLPIPLDADHKIGQFVKGNYAPHRFIL